MSKQKPKKSYDSKQRAIMFRLFVEHYHKSFDNPETLQNLTPIFTAIKKYQQQWAAPYILAEAQYYRMEAIAILANLYKRHRIPSEVPKKDLLNLLNSRFGFTPCPPKRIAETLHILQRNKENLLGSRAEDESVLYADKTLSSAIRIEKLSLEQLAAVNLNAFFSLYPRHPQSKVKISSSWFSKLKKDQTHWKLIQEDLEYEFPRGEITKLFLNEVIKCSPKATDQIVDLIYRDRFEGMFK